MLRLLRPAEAAARRLIIIAARGLVVELSPPRLRAAKPKPILNRSNGFGTGVVIRPGPLPEWARALAPKRSSTLSLPLFDPLKRFGGRRYVKQRDVPRIRSFDDPRIGFFQPPRAPDPLAAIPGRSARCGPSASPSRSDGLGTGRPAASGEAPRALAGARRRQTGRGRRP